MRRTSSLLRFFSAFVLAAALHNAQALPVAGKDYVVISPAQPTETGDKIEVLEAFSYMCPHCHQFEPPLSKWIKTLPADVVVRKLPIGFSRDSWTNLSKVYYTLEAMGELDKLHGKVFEAIHVQHVQLSDPDALFDWAAKQGLDRKKFIDVYNSFAVQSKIARLPQLTRNYGIESVPTLIVDGKYRIVGGASHEELLRIANELIVLARSQRPAKAAMAETSPATGAKSSKEPAKKASGK